MFVEINEKATASKFFSDIWTLKELPILDDRFEEICCRNMKAYLVKSEADF